MNALCKAHVTMSAQTHKDLLRVHAEQVMNFP